MDFVPPSCIYDDPAGDTPPNLDVFFTATGALAALATFEEAMLSPKPGLVCPDSDGSHSDMNWVTFVMASSALAPFWRRQVMGGFRLGHYKPLPMVAERLRETGKEMESAMFMATGGVNTHKGLIFALSLLLGASGVCARRGGLTREAVLETSGAMIAPRMEEEFNAISRRGERGERLTHGEKIYFLRGMGGVRAEASKGFPSVKLGLETLEDALRLGAAYKDAAISAPLALMANCEDTNVIHRGGVAFWQDEYRDLALEALGKFDPLEPGSYEPVRELDSVLIERGVSPGGAADMLGCTLFMYRSKISGNII